MTAITQFGKLLKMFLIQHDLFCVVDSSEPNLGPADATLLRTWKFKDAKARSDLILHDDNRQIQIVQSLNTSKDIWDKL